MGKTVKNLKIGELASTTGCQVETVRYYEREKLLPAPARSEGNYRLYSTEHVELLMFIRHCRSLDMTLDEVRRLLHFKDAPEENCGEVNVLLDKHIEGIAARMAELEHLQAQMIALRAQCHEDQEAKHCGILQGLASPGNL
ncbi:MAG: Cd(II)/Pb(II)-responsive transcriptional regulator [Rhodocyclales bacterium]|nr:Cd(II)/Pb(II)-responsive transcriptional regulator [Rhodocyclales bacterium]